MRLQIVNGAVSRSQLWALLCALGGSSLRTLRLNLVMKLTAKNAKVARSAAKGLPVKSSRTTSQPVANERKKPLPSRSQLTSHGLGL